MNIQLAKKTLHDGKIVSCDIYVDPEELPIFLETIDAAGSGHDKLEAFIRTEGAGALSTPGFYVTFLDRDLGKLAAASLS